jgi:hypothetical protein
MHETLYSCGFSRTLSVENNAALGGLKSTEKQPISTVFMGFCGYFFYFSRFLPVFGYFRAIPGRATGECGRAKTRMKCG